MLFCVAFVVNRNYNMKIKTHYHSYKMKSNQITFSLFPIIASNIYDIGFSVVTTTKKPHPVPAPVPKPKQKECMGCGRPIGKGNDQCSSPSYY